MNILMAKDRLREFVACKGDGEVPPQLVEDVKTVLDALIIANTTQANLHAVITAKNYAIAELERDYALLRADAQRWQTWHDEKAEQCRELARQLLDAESRVST